MDIDGARRSAREGNWGATGWTVKRAGGELVIG